MYWSLCYKLYASKNSKKLKLPLLPEFDGYQPDATKVRGVQVWSQNWVAILPILSGRQWTPPWRALVMVDNSLPFLGRWNDIHHVHSACRDTQSRCWAYYKFLLSMRNNDWRNDSTLIITLHFLRYNTAFISTDRRRIKNHSNHSDNIMG